MLEMIFRIFLGMGRLVVSFDFSFFSTEVDIYHFPYVIYKEFDFQKFPPFHWIFHDFHKEIEVIGSHG